MKVLTSILALMLVVVIVVGFFLPWVNAESKNIGTLSKLITGKRISDIGVTISAFQIPIMANSKDAKLIISIIELFNPGIENADKKSYLAWVIPIFAAILFLLLLFRGDNKWVTLAIALVGISIFAFATYKINTTDLNRLFTKVTVEKGAWLTLYGFLGIGVVSTIKFLQSLIKK